LFLAQFALDGRTDTNPIHGDKNAEAKFIIEVDFYFLALLCKIMQFADHGGDGRKDGSLLCGRVDDNGCFLFFTGRGALGLMSNCKHRNLSFTY